MFVSFMSSARLINSVFGAGGAYDGF